MRSWQPRHPALFGGSFDPPHRGHVAMAAAAVAVCGLDRVVFIPCRESPMKGRRPEASGEQRVAMLRGVAAGLPWGLPSGLKWPPALMPSPLEQSPFSCT